MKAMHAMLLAAVLALQACGGSDTRWQADLKSVTNQVVSYQDAGSELASLVGSADDELVQLSADDKVRLISASKNSCPDRLEGCSTTDSSTLGVGSSALVASLSDIKASIRDQSERGTCGAFALNGGVELLLSRQEQDAFTSKKTRWVKETYWPCSGYSLNTAHQLYASIGRIKRALYRGYPVVMSVNANYDFQLATYKGGVVSWAVKADSCGTSLCGHEVLVVGYQDSDQVQGGGYFIIKNSWSADWGDEGVAYVTYEWLQHSLLDAQAPVRIDSAAAT